MENKSLVVLSDLPIICLSTFSFSIFICLSLAASLSVYDSLFLNSVPLLLQLFSYPYTTLNLSNHIQARIAQLVAYRLGTREIPGSNPGKAKNITVKISNWIVQI